MTKVGPTPGAGEFSTRTRAMLAARDDEPTLLPVEKLDWENMATGEFAAPEPKPRGRWRSENWPVGGLIATGLLGTAIVAWGLVAIFLAMLNGVLS